MSQSCHGQLKGEGMTDEDKQLIAEYNEKLTGSERSERSGAAPG